MRWRKIAGNKSALWVADMEKRDVRATFFTGAALLVAAISTAPAYATKPVSPTPPPACSVVTFSEPTVSCLGFYSGNLVAESGPKLDTALNDVDGLDSLATSLIKKIDWKGGQDPNVIDFGMPLSGKTVIGIHFGGGKNGYNGTGFWLLDLPTTINTISYTSSVETGISNAGLYLTSAPQGGVPEPSTWAMMLLGFGSIGWALRQRRKGLQQQLLAKA